MERELFYKNFNTKNAPKYDSSWFVCISENGSLQETVQSCLTNVHFFIYQIEWTYDSKLDG